MNNRRLALCILFSLLLVNSVSLGLYSNPLTPPTDTSSGDAESFRAKCGRTLQWLNITRLLMRKSHIPQLFDAPLFGGPESPRDRLIHALDESYKNRSPFQNFPPLSKAEYRKLRWFIAYTPAGIFDPDPAIINLKYKDIIDVKDEQGRARDIRIEDVKVEHAYQIVRDLLASKEDEVRRNGDTMIVRGVYLTSLEQGRSKAKWLGYGILAAVILQHGESAISSVSATTNGWIQRLSFVTKDAVQDTLGHGRDRKIVELSDPTLKEYEDVFDDVNQSFTDPQYESLEMLREAVTLVNTIRSTLFLAEQNHDQKAIEANLQLLHDLQSSFRPILERKMGAPIKALIDDAFERYDPKGDIRQKFK